MEAAPATTFGVLHAELIRHLRALIHSGVTTERSLARVTGISQPHLHNALKGKRVLSSEKADRILLHLRLDLRSLLKTAEEPSD